MIRKPYTITKSREIWTEPEHDKFLEALHLYQDDKLSPLAQRLCASSMSPDSNIGKNSPWNGSLSLIEYKVNKKDGAADASTQTEDICKTRRICARGVSTDDGLLDPKSSNTCLNEGLKIKETSQICRDLTSPPPSTSNTSSSGRPHTLEALIKADARKLKSFRILGRGGIENAIWYKTQGFKYYNATDLPWLGFSERSKLWHDSNLKAKVFS